ncbi:SpoIID/LytB domain-containing protein [Caldanaerobacter sp.]|uniref:SpoIID/LytB domain-containing protein n=1 Tax=Caldanaerobacter sp. TaxID=2930036 RepID=UPI003C772265
MIKLRKILVFFFVASLIFSLTACKKPVKKPEPIRKPKMEMPKIPAKISRGENKEPILKVYVVQKGRIEEMPLEKYVEGTVAGEIKNDWPIEAIKAQAILARTYVLNFVKTKKSKYKGADISTDFEEAQAWNPVNVNERIKKAVEETRGVVLVYNGDFINAWFHSHSGGQTALSKEGLNYKKSEPPYIVSVKSKESARAPRDIKNWEVSFTKGEVLNALKKMGLGMNDFKEVKIAKRGPSGRVVTLMFDKTHVNAPDFRMAIGSERLKSTFIEEVSFDGNRVFFKGKGFGHGVGMSQWGAYQMAEEGKKAKDILNYYFKGVEIVKIWD